MLNVPHGFCSRCNKANIYRKITCDYCGKRLPWANVLAVDAGEKCPQCSAFNRYDESNCASCSNELPWAEASGFLRRARAKSDSEENSLFAVVISCAIIFWVYMMWQMAKH